jgi:putative transposase
LFRQVLSRDPAHGGTAGCDLTAPRASLANSVFRQHIAFVGLRFKDQTYGSSFFVTTSFHERRRFGDMPGVYEILADSLRYYIGKYNALLPAYVFMPTHIHLLLVIDGDQLAGFMCDFKKFVSQKSIRECGEVPATVWQSRYDRVAIQSESAFRQKLEYIHRNPVKAGLVAAPDQWVWSSAAAYLSAEPVPIPIWKEWVF